MAVSHAEISGGRVGVRGAEPPHEMNGGPRGTIAGDFEDPAVGDDFNLIDDLSD
jgi:hypothetical protein